MMPEMKQVLQLPNIACTVLLLCCTLRSFDVLFLDYQIFREVPSCVNAVTFFQFLFIAFEGFIFTANFGFKKPVIPIR